MDILNDIEALQWFFHHYGLRDNKIIKSIQDSLIKIELSNKTIIFMQNQPAKSLFFLPKGVSRYYIIDIEGVEHTKSLRMGPTFLGSFYAIHGGGENPFTAEIVHASSLYSLDLNYWRGLLEKDTTFIKFYVNFITDLFIEKEKRELSFLQESAEERYHQFQKTYAELIDNIPKWITASFLGITPETLSRIRKR